MLEGAVHLCEKTKCKYVEYFANYGWMFAMNALTNVSIPSELQHHHIRSCPRDYACVSAHNISSPSMMFHSSVTTWLYIFEFGRRCNSVLRNRVSVFPHLRLRVWFWWGKRSNHRVKVSWYRVSNYSGYRIFRHLKKRPSKICNYAICRVIQLSLLQCPKSWDNTSLTKWINLFMPINDSVTEILEIQRAK